MTTTLRRRPEWPILAAMFAAAGCGPPPPMVTMAPPGVSVDPLAIDVEDEAYKARALGETPVVREKKASSDQESVIREPTEPNKEILTDSGLLYTTIEPGDPDGLMAEVGDQISVLYKGTLQNGTVFDSNMDRAPLDFRLESGPMGVIQGWVEGIPGMRVGERRRLTIPPKLAYGERGNPPTIPPNSALTFEVELLDVRKGG